MATDRELLATCAAAVSTKPACQLLVDWGGAGTFDNRAAWTDETQYVITARGEMASTGVTKTLTMLGQGVSSVCYVTLRNPIDPVTGARFSPTNAAGPLYADLGQGKIRMTRAQFLAGYYDFTNFVPNPGFETLGAGGADVFGSWVEHTELGGTIAASATAYAGAYAALLSSLGLMTNNYMSVQVPVDEDTDHTLSFWARGDSTHDGEYSLWDDDNAADIIVQTGTGVTAATWTQVSVAFHAPAGCSTVTLFLYPDLANACAVLFDQVSITRADPILTEQLTGYIVDSKEDSKAGTVTFEIRDRSVAMATMYVSSPVAEFQSARECVTAWLALQDRDALVAANQEIDPGVVLHRYSWLDEDDESLWGELGRLAEAHGGRVWISRDGMLNWEDMSHQAKPHTLPEDDPTISQYTFTVADYAACDPQYDPRAVINHVILEYEHLYAGVADVVYQMNETLVVAPLATEDVDAVFDDPCLSIESPVQYDTDTEEGDYRAVSAGRVDMSSLILVTLSPPNAQRATITIENTDPTYPAFVVMLQLRGVPLLSAEKLKIELEDAGSMAQYGRQTWKPANRYIRSRVHAETLAEHVLDRFKAPPLTIRLRGVPCVPFLEPGNRVTVTETLGGTGINEPFFITKLTWTWGNSFEMTLDLVRAADLYPYSDYFVIGTSKYGDPTHPNPNALAGRLAW